MADGISNLESKSTPLPKQSVELIRATLEDMRKHGLMSGLPQEHAFTLLEEIERLTNDVALLQMLQQTMEECIGVTEAQSFEARAEELMVTEAQHKQCSAVETTVCWSVFEHVDGHWRRNATANWWAKNEDAHRQREDLESRHRERIFAVRSSVEPSEQRTCLGCGQPYPCPSDCPAGTIVSVTK